MYKKTFQRLKEIKKLSAEVRDIIISLICQKSIINKQKCMS